MVQEIQVQFSDSSFFPSSFILAYCKPNPNTDSAENVYEEVAERRAPVQILRGQSFGSSILNGWQRCKWVWQAATRTDKLQSVRLRE